MLQRAFSRDRVPHAYIFHGPDGVGKETLARGVAQLLLCDSPIETTLGTDAPNDTSAPIAHAGCGKCESCRLVLAQTHPDVHSVYRQLNRQHPDADVRKRTGREIGVDVIRHFLIDKVHLTPSHAKAKVFLLREADRITPQAQNALLKTLEEPAGATYLILLTAHLDRLLPTTQSRCQLVEFNALPTVFVRDKLASLHPRLSGDHLDWYARSADGSLGGAMEAIGLDLQALGEQVIESIIKLDEASVPRTVKAWTASAESVGGRSTKGDPDITDTEARRIGLKIIFRIASNWYADVLRVRTGRCDDLVNVGHASALARVADELDYDVIIECINRLARTEQQLDRNAHVQLCVENLLNDLACGVPV